MRQEHSRRKQKFASQCTIARFARGRALDKSCLVDSALTSAIESCVKQMANGSMEIEYTHHVIQGIPSSIRIQEQCYRVPAIKITHYFEGRSILKTKTRAEKTAKNVKFMTQRNEKTGRMTEAGTCVQCNSNASQRVPCADNCLSLRLPLEVELNVLGVVDQGMIDRGEMAKIRRVGSRKRNSAPNILVETLPVEAQKSRPSSFTSTSCSDLSTLLNRQSLQSTTLCSTEL